MSDTEAADATLENEPPTTVRYPEQAKGRRGFAAMPVERRREISAKGGRAAHAQGVAHRWTPEEGSAAGKKGVEARRRKRA